MDGIDLAQGMERFNDLDVYLDVLRTFCLHTPALLEKIRNLSRDEAGIVLHDYAVIVHGIKGSCYGISANAHADEAALLEEAAKAGDKKQIIEKNDAFIEMMQSLLTSLDELLKKAGSLNREYPL